MNQNFQKIIQQVKYLQPTASTKNLEQAYDFLVKNSNSFEQPENIVRASLKNVQNFSLLPIQTNFLAVLLLSNLFVEDNKILNKIKTNFSQDIYILCKAYQLSHNNLGITKIYNRDIFDHTLQTTIYLAQLKLGYKTLAASLLKHVPEFSNITFQQIRNEFGSEISSIFKNVLNLKNLLPNAKEKNIDHLRQMFLAMAKDLRSILIKICSVIDLLKNIEEINPKLRYNLAIEAMDIYAPIADILGAWRLKWQLEDYAFKFLNLAEYKKIEKKFNVDEKKNREKYIEKTKLLLQKKAAEHNIKCRIDGRFKHFYSIYCKMQDKKKSFNEVYDVFALRVVVESIPDCYSMLGIIHALWKPKPRRIKDYISQPKANKYQSLHTTVFGLNKRMTEFQIRTYEMNEQAKYGVAAHWKYKNENENTPQWIREILKEKTKIKNKQEFFENVKTEILINKIFVYTPKGDLISLPKNSTPIDFAYKIHSNLGRRCHSALVNEKIVPLDFQLQNEDLVQIITDQQQTKPKKTWLKFVKSNLAKKRIKEQLA